jgi:hypothetical protein
VSRSEHATRRHPCDPGDLDRKRRIKAFVDEERARPRRVLPSVDPTAVTISIRDVGPYFHYPAGVDDLWAILARVPPGVADGLDGVELCIDRSPPEDGDEAVDPWLGVLTEETMRGVWSSTVLGVYRWGERSRIQLHGYAFDPALRDRAVVQLVLRLQMLATFVHELGHHHDRRERTARGRWRGDATDHELHAEAIERAWTCDHVIPYLEEVYPDELAALERWLVRHGGVALPLATLIGDPRSNSDETGEQRLFSVRSAFAHLFEDVQDQRPVTETRVGFARELHYGTHYAEALAILDHVTREDADDVQGRVLRADIYVHQERHDDAESIVVAVLAQLPDHVDALEVLTDIARARGDWRRVRELAARRTALLEPASWPWRSSMQEELRALLVLGEIDAADGLLATSDATETRGLLVLEAMVRLRQGRHAEALAIVATVGSPRHLPEAVAVMFEASHRLGVPCDAEAVLAVLDRLRRMGHTVWADQLQALGTPQSP